MYSNNYENDEGGEADNGDEDEENDDNETFKSESIDEEDEEFMNDETKDYLQFYDGMKKTMKYYSLIPEETIVSTITLTCFLNRNILVNNIIKYFDDYDDLLIHKVYGGICYSAGGVSAKIKNKKNRKNNFSNVSFIFDTYKLMGVVKPGKQRKMNVKLFYSGSIHMTGCHDLSNVEKCLTLILEKLKKIKTIDDKEIYFLEDVNVSMLNVSNLIIRMMNTSSYSDYSIDLDAMFEEVKKIEEEQTYPVVDKGYDCKKILIKLSLEEEVSLFIFDAGSINISAKNFKDLIRSYYIVNNILYSNYLYKNPIDIRTIVQFLKDEKN